MLYLKHAPWVYFSRFDTKHNHRKMDFGKHAQRVKPKSQRSAQRSVFCPEPPLGPRCPACQEQAQTKSMLSLCRPAAAVKRMDKCQPFPSIYCQTHNQILTLLSNAQLTLVLSVKSARQSVLAPFFGEYTTKWVAKHLRTSSVSHCCLMWLQSTLQSHQIQPPNVLQPWISPTRSHSAALQAWAVPKDETKRVKLLTHQVRSSIWFKHWRDYIEW